MTKTSMTLGAKLLGLSFVVAFATVAEAKELHLKAGHLQLLNNAFMTEASETKTDYYIVQFKNELSYKNRQALEKLGAEFKSYIPDDALLVKMNPNVHYLVKQEMGSQLEQVVAYIPEFKISPNIRPSVFNNNSELPLIVRANTDKDATEVLKSLAELEGMRVEDVDGRMIYLVSEISKVYEIAKIDGVEWIEELPEFELAYMSFGANQKDDKGPMVAGDYSDLTGYESGTAIMNFDFAYGRGLTGEGQVGAMADTGLDTGLVGAGNIHADFGNVFKGYAEGLFSKTWADPHGHGTHVAGSVMGSGAASNGKVVGGAYGASLVAQGMWSKMMNNMMVPPKLGEMFARSYSDGARVHTNSWGSPQNLGAYNNFAAQVDEFMWNNPDMLVIFAAGNSGVDMNKDGRIDEGSVSSPSTAKNVLTVGASENLEAKGGIQKPVGQLRDGDRKWGAEPIASDKLSDNANGIAAFSSRGPTQDGRLKPDVVAPGTNILSGRSSVEGASTLWGAYNEHYVWAGGTSMATPLTAGAALVIREYLHKYRNQKNPSAALLKASLVHTATDLFPGQYGTGAKQELTRRPNNHEGYGRVDLAKQVLLDYAHIDDNKAGIAEGKSRSVELTLDRDSGFIATLAYTDAPGSASAAKALVNDLDLELKSVSTGKVMKISDSLNNLEMIETAVKKGKYIITVRAKRIVNGKAGKQPYALIVSTY